LTEKKSKVTGKVLSQGQEEKSKKGTDSIPKEKNVTLIFNKN